MSTMLLSQPAFWGETSEWNREFNFADSTPTSDVPTKSRTPVARKGDVAPTARQSVRARNDDEKDLVGFFSRVELKGVTNKKLVHAAVRLWWSASFLMSHRLLVPLATASAGGPICFTWVTGKHRLFVEMFETGRCDWSLFDRSTKATTGDELETDELLGVKEFRDALGLFGY